MAYQLWDIKWEDNEMFTAKPIAKELTYEQFICKAAGAMVRESKIEWWLMEEKNDGWHVVVKFKWVKD